MDVAGFAGWVGVAACVVVADAIAIRRGTPTLSSLFARHRGWAIPVWAALTAHLIIQQP